MQLYIPEIGDKIKLKKDWIFTLYPEERNKKLGEKLGFISGDSSKIQYNKDWIDEKGKIVKWIDLQNRGWINNIYTITWNLFYQITIKKGTVLKIDRIYIRKGKDMKDYSSLTFIIEKGDYSKARFWAKLNEVNTIEFEKLID